MLPQNYMSYDASITPRLLTHKSSALVRPTYLSSLYSSDSVVSHLVLYQLPEVRTMTQIIIVWSIPHDLDCDRDIYLNSLRSHGGSCVPPVRNSLHKRRIVTCAFPEATLSTPCRISNKFLYHHCHVDTAKEGNMLNVQSVPNITPCVIVSQRKPIVCPGEAPQSQGLSSDS